MSVRQLARLHHSPVDWSRRAATKKKREYAAWKAVIIAPSYIKAEHRDLRFTGSMLPGQQIRLRRIETRKFLPDPAKPPQAMTKMLQLYISFA